MLPSFIFRSLPNADAASNRDLHWHLEPCQRANTRLWWVCVIWFGICMFGRAVCGRVKLLGARAGHARFSSVFTFYQNIKWFSWFKQWNLESLEFKWYKIHIPYTTPFSPCNATANMSCFPSHNAIQFGPLPRIPHSRNQQPTLSDISLCLYFHYTESDGTMDKLTES